MPSYHTCFMFTSGIKDTMKVPVGTCEKIREHVERITEECSLKVKQFEDNSLYWERYEPAECVDNDTASCLVRFHNNWVEWLHGRLETWSKNPPKKYEEMTPEFVETVWHGFFKLQLPFDRWSAEYYQEEMQRLFDVMRGEEDDGIIWNGDPLTPRQAAEVIHLFDTYLDKHDVRLELPQGWDDHLLNSDEYDWCPEHGAIPVEDTEYDETNDTILCPECKASL
jgi:hypothetical protein